MSVPVIFHSEVKAIFQSYSPQIRKRMKQLRTLVFSAADTIDEVEGVLETVKWGEPSYLPIPNKKGTTIRIDCKDQSSEICSVFLNCRTSIITDAKEIFGDVFKYKGNREIYFLPGDTVPENQLLEIFTWALTYHARKKS